MERGDGLDETSAVLKGGATARRLGGREPFEVDYFHAPPIGIMFNAEKFPPSPPPPPVPPPMAILHPSGVLTPAPGARVPINIYRVFHKEWQF